jgi:Tfp pilus assembly protein PilF
MVAVAVAVTAIVLGSGVSAAVTGGRSVNPLTGIQQVVAQLSGERTQDQREAYEAATRALDLAESYADRGQDDRARAELRKALALTDRLTEQDEDVVLARARQLEERISR